MTKSIQSNNEYEAKWYQQGYEEGWKDRDSDYQDVRIDSPLEAYKEELKKRIGWLKIITPIVEPPPNNLSQSQIFASGQVNMLMRVREVLDD